MFYEVKLFFLGINRTQGIFIMRKLAQSVFGRYTNLNIKITTGITTLLFFLGAIVASPLQAADDAVVQVDGAPHDHPRCRGAGCWGG